MAGRTFTIMSSTNQYGLTSADFMLGDMATIMHLERRIRVGYRIKKAYEYVGWMPLREVEDWIGDMDDTLCALRHRLVLNKNIPHEHSRFARLLCDKYGKRRRDIEKLFGLNKGIFRPYSNILRHWLAIKKEKAAIAQSATHKARIHMACQRAHREGKYMVFNTLTVAPEHIETVFGKGSKVFYYCMRDITRAVGKTCGYTAAQSDKRGEELHEYFGTVELGGETGHVHIHVLQILEELPEGSVDPNIGRCPTHLEIDAMKSYWTYGWSSPRPMRYGHRDRFSREGWLWPLIKNKKTLLTKPLRAGKIEMVGNYIGKYINKQGIQGKWKTRKTRNFGFKTLLSIMSKQSSRELMQALRAPKRLLTPKGVPHWSILRALMKRSLIKRGHFRRAFLVHDFQEPICKPGALERLLARAWSNIMNVGLFNHPIWTRVISEYVGADTGYGLTGGMASYG